MILYCAMSSICGTPIDPGAQQEHECYNLEGGRIEDLQATVPLYQRDCDNSEMLPRQAAFVNLKK